MVFDWNEVIHSSSHIAPLSVLRIIFVVSLVHGSVEIDLCVRGLILDLARLALANVKTEWTGQSIDPSCHCQTISLA